MRTVVPFATVLLSGSVTHGFHTCKGNRAATTVLLLATRSSSSSSTPPAVIHGDARLPATYASLVTATGRADVLVTDPPYCLLVRRRKEGQLRDPKKRNKLDGEETVPRYESVREYKRFTEEWLTAAVAHGLKPDAVLIVWTNALGKAPITDVARALGYEGVGEYLWAKRTAQAAASAASTKNEVLMRVYESALVFAKPTDAATAAKLTNAPGDPPLPWSVITGYHDDPADGRHDHPCHKPFAALEPLLRAWSKPGDVVLDCFAGSGGILHAAARLQRRAVGVEVLPDWAVRANDAVREGEVGAKPPSPAAAPATAVTPPATATAEGTSPKRTRARSEER